MEGRREGGKREGRGRGEGTRSQCSEASSCGLECDSSAPREKRMRKTVSKTRKTSFETSTADNTVFTKPCTEKQKQKVCGKPMNSQYRGSSRENYK